MENSHQKPLATESFSYSWLIDQKTDSCSSPSPSPSDNIIRPINFPENSHRKDPMMMINFNFDVPTRIMASPQNISMPAVYNNDLRYLQRSYASVPSSPFSYATPSYNDDSSKRQHVLLGKWRRSSKRILQKCVGFVKQLQIGSSRKNSRVDDLERKVCEVRSYGNSVEASPRRTYTGTTGGYHNYRVHDHFVHGLKKVKSWNGIPRPSPRTSPLPAATAPSRYASAWTCHDRDAESSIHEAIQYCKRSIEK